MNSAFVILRQSKKIENLKLLDPNLLLRLSDLQPFDQQTGKISVSHRAPGAL
jgi:hypothetical protein